MNEANEANGAARHAHDDCICCEASAAIGKLFRAIRPSEKVSEHFRQSRVEFLKGIRTLLDERIDHIGRPPHKGTRVVVE
jgi:hypothetical protein